MPCAGPVRLDDSAESIGSTVLVEIDGGIAVAWSTWKEMQRIHSTNKPTEGEIGRFTTKLTA